MSKIEDAFGFNDNIVESPVEKVISTFAYVALLLGCLVSLIYGISLMDKHSTQGLGVSIIVGGIIYSVIIWAILMIIANISNNIRQIKYELKKQNSKDKEN